jgi:hypothetical protein
MIENKIKYFANLISTLEKTNLSVNILFVTKKDATYDVRKANLSDDVSETIRKLCLRISKKSYSKIENKTFEKYNPANKGSSTTEFLEGTELEKIKPILNLFEGELVDLKKVDGKFLDSLWFYVIKISDGESDVLFIKKYSKGMVLAKSLGLAFAFRAGNFDKLKQNIFQIYDKIDCILFKDKLIIRSKGNFEKIFDFFEQIKKNAQNAITFVEEKLPFKIDNFDEIKKTWMEHEIKIRKLNNIYATKTLEKINPSNIKILVSEGILKNTTTKINGGVLTIKSDDPWELLNILDDDYVKSRLTNINYEASIKKEI